jgi:hypothetical protein
VTARVHTHPVACPGQGADRPSTRSASAASIAVCPASCWFFVERQVWEAAQQCRESDPHFHPRQRRPEAVVHTVAAESQVTGRAAADVEGVRRVDEWGS